MTMAQIQIQMMTAGTKPFGIKVSRDKASFSPNITMLTMTMMAFPMVKTSTMTTMVPSTSIKNCSVSGVRNNHLGTTIMMAF